MSFIKEQAKREMQSGKRVWGWYLWLVVIFWGFIGLAMLATAAWLVGVIFVLAAGYMGYRLWSKKQG